MSTNVEGEAVGTMSGGHAPHGVRGRRGSPETRGEEGESERARSAPIVPLTRSWSTSIPFDEDVTATMAGLSYGTKEGGEDPSSPPAVAIPTMYIDDAHLIQEIYDLTQLKHGDHCVVGLNPIRKVHPWIDAAFMWAGSWEILRLYHHFIVYDDVVSISEDGTALNKHGTPAMIVEYSNTPIGAIKQVFRRGPLSLYSDPAPFQKIELNDYPIWSGGRGRKSHRSCGVYRIMQNLSDRRRQQIISEATSQLESHEPYSFTFLNCEHAAFELSSERSVSPQVPMLTWNLLSFIIRLCGVACLQRNHYFLMFCYHLFAVVPVALQTAIHLIRCTVHLTEIRESLGDALYHHLLSKEFCRAVFVGIGSITPMAMLPALYQGGTVKWRYCIAIASFSYFIANIIYSALAKVTVYICQHTSWGVPVMLFVSDISQARKIEPTLSSDTKDATGTTGTSAGPKGEKLGHIEPCNRLASSRAQVAHAPLDADADADIARVAAGATGASHDDSPTLAGTDVDGVGERDSAQGQGQGQGHGGVWGYRQGILTKFGVPSSVITAGLFSIFCVAVSIAVIAPPLPLLWGPWEASWWDAMAAVRAFIRGSRTWNLMKALAKVALEAARPLIDGTIQPALGQVRGAILGVVSH